MSTTAAFEPDSPKRGLVQRACKCSTGETCDQCDTPELPPATAPLQRAAVPGSAQVFSGGDTRGFMAQLRSSITEMADAELSEVGRSADGCPYIQHWLAHYESRDATHLQRAIQRYAKPGDHTEAGYQDAILSRVRGALRVWKSTGQVTGVPEEPTSHASSIGATLGSGQPLDSGIRGKLESSYGSDLSAVRVHTGGAAPAMAQSMSALAFTAGSNIGFAPGMYRPGTTAGDMLIAHEVAHTVQQGGVEHPDNALDSHSEQQLEADADRAATSAIVGGAAAKPAAASGLTLQRCSNPCVRYPQSGLRLDIERKRDCGLLAPPFLPPGVGTFPDYSPSDDLGNRPLDPSCYPMGPSNQLAALGGGGGLAQGKLVQRQVPMPIPIEPPMMPPMEPFPIPEFPIPELPIPELPVPDLPIPELPELGPGPGPAPLPGPTPVPPTWPGPFPVAPMPHPAPVPDAREDDQRYLDRLTPEQLDYYRWLREAERLEPESGEDADDEMPDVCPSPSPDEDEEEDEEPGCVAYPTYRRGGHAEHDAYATDVSLSPSDYYVRTPSNQDINYDGKTPLTKLVWEVKVRHGWFFNCAKRAQRDLTLARWDAQKDRGMAVAAACDYHHVWACKEPHVAYLLRNRWGGVPWVRAR